MVLGNGLVPETPLGVGLQRTFKWAKGVLNVE